MAAKIAVHGPGDHLRHDRTRSRAYGWLARPAVIPEIVLRTMRDNVRKHGGL